jgi:translation initiation factor IF-2
VRDGIVIYDGKLLSLKRFKDDAKEVSSGFECGIGIEGFNDIRVNDIIEAYTKNKIERKL